MCLISSQSFAGPALVFSGASKLVVFNDGLSIIDFDRPVSGTFKAACIHPKLDYKVSWLQTSPLNLQISILKHFGMWERLESFCAHSLIVHQDAESRFVLFYDSQSDSKKKTNDVATKLVRHRMSSSSSGKYHAIPYNSQPYNGVMTGLKDERIDDRSTMEKFSCRLEIPGTIRGDAILTCQKLNHDYSWTFVDCPDNIPILSKPFKWTAEIKVNNNG
jgi:hypothetical protein